MNSSPPRLGPPVRYIHVIWLAAFPENPHEFFDELDADRWSIRCVRVYRNRSHVACSYCSSNWREVMPEAPIPVADAINQDSQFLAREISREDFEVVWQQAVKDAGSKA